MAKKKTQARVTPADRLLLAIASSHGGSAKARRGREVDDALAATAVSEDLLVRLDDGTLVPTAAGRARAARLAAERDGEHGLDPFLAQHLAPATRATPAESGPARVVVDEGESPLVWLARRKGRDGTALIVPVQLQAGERLRADFTRAQLTPRVTSSWSGLASEKGRGGRGSGSDLLDAAIAARQRVRHALEGVGPEFAGLLLDVCCFLKGLEEVERERQWPARSAKVVLQLGLDRLARHYGYAAEARGPQHAAVRTWLAEGAAFSADLFEGGERRP